MLALTALVAALTLALTGTAAASTDDCYSRDGCTQEARSAKDFTDSVGVNTHLGYHDSVYWQQWPTVRDRLRELGVSHIRDGTFAENYAGISLTTAARYRELDSYGIKGNLLVGEEQNQTGNSTVAGRLAWIKNNGLVPFTIGIEGENESYRDSASIRAQQCEVWNAVKNDSVLSSKLVIGPSSGDGGDDHNWYRRVGDLSHCLDRGNLHPYPGEDPPHRRLSRPFQTAMDWGRTTYGSKTHWSTENGYWNKSPNANHVSERAAGTYVPRMVLDQFRHGVERTQLYELIDQNTNALDQQHNYGLLRTDGTRKPAFTALRNLLALVKDTRPASGQLGFGIECTANCRQGDPDAYPTRDGPIRHVLLRHSAGAYYLAVWSESTVWDPATRTDTPKPAQSFRLHLHQAPAQVEIFDPNDATTPVTTDTSGSQTVTTVATDTLRLIKIIPRSAPPPSVSPPALRAEAVSADRTGPAPGERSAPPRKTICSRPKAVKTIMFSKERYANIRAHYVRAVKRGWPRILVLNRKGANQRRDRLLRKMPTMAGGRDRAQYPPAIGRGRGSRALKRGRKPAGWLADVRDVPLSEGWSHRTELETTLERFCDGTRFRYSFK